MKLLPLTYLCCALSSQSHAQTLPSWTFSSFLNVVTAEKMDAGIRIEDRQHLDAIAASLTILRSSALAAYGDKVTDAHQLKKALALPYWNSMAADYDSLLKSRTDAALRSGLLVVIDRDLAAKSAYIHDANPGAGYSGNFPTNVKVTVRTVDHNGAPRSNLYVRANPEAYGLNSSPLYVFNSATSPETTADMPPGRSVLWVEDAAKRRLQSEPVTIGDGGKDAESFTITIP